MMGNTYKDENLFYYCKLNTAIEYILTDKQILLSPLLNTNDPRENKQFTFKIIWNEETASAKTHNDGVEFSRFIRQDAKVICFSECYENQFGYEYAKMWAHYGDNHKGVCLRINKKAFLEENGALIDKSLLRKIEYLDLDIRRRIPHKEINYIEMDEIGKDKYLKNEFRKKHLDYLFFTKDKEWESEREMRLLYFGDTNKREYCSIKNSLEEILLGVDFHYSYLPSVKHLCPEIETSQMKYKGGVRLIACQLDNRIV